MVDVEHTSQTLALYHASFSLLPMHGILDSIYEFLGIALKC
ncbi:hypothetical protein APHNP_0215 [Anaplasma phagocytophilum str. ApNP]|uniref:Uncharacterized protein n=1 Tax=Anaplasma phagocytophilum str. ApNP TaxID=1359153 RepID=A0A0F3NIX7_ANAPH|nr:hypothetical protein APHNP_0215 [Anaplasma phagocytophilum str. ApNP]